MVDLLNELMEILGREYGINSPAELEEALAKQERIDITPFAGAVKKEVRKAV